MNTIKLNTIGEGPAKAKVQEGGGTPLVFDLTDYWNSSEDMTIPVTDEIISAILSFNIIFKIGGSIDNDYAVGSVARCQTLLDYEFVDMTNKETEEYDNVISINTINDVGLFQNQAAVDLTTKELKIILPK